MLVGFSVEYYARYGQNIVLSISDKKSSREYVLDCEAGSRWKTQIELHNKTVFEYHYFLRDNNNQPIVSEKSGCRTLDTAQIGTGPVLIVDQWKDHDPAQELMNRAAFTGGVFYRDIQKKPKNAKKTSSLIFNITAPRVSPEHAIYISGSDPALGGWEIGKAVKLDADQYPLWSAGISLMNSPEGLEYKYLIKDGNEALVLWEKGPNRKLKAIGKDNTSPVIVHDNYFNYDKLWRGSGLAIPVFSLRTADSNGVGEFEDLRQMVDFASISGLKLIQLLPINDTIANHNFKDSYPYSGISIFALHPIYVRPQLMGKLKGKEAAGLEKTRKSLNALNVVDYEEVMPYKWNYFRLLFDQEKKNILKDEAFLAFVGENADWIKSYALFCYFRDIYETSDFATWPQNSVFDETECEKLTSPDSEIYEQVVFHWWIQYHAHLQLSDVVRYSRSKHVALKGDLPIGIYRNSCDAWVKPVWYNMNGQAGAPPDAFAVLGQNWGFPTYNWDEMSKDNYKFWRDRLTHMSRYFDAYRIDHILGFFRIWQIPLDQINGILGVFNPDIPFSEEELRNAGLNWDEKRYCGPFIQWHLLESLFGEYASWVVSKFLNLTGRDYYELKPEFNNQIALKAAIEAADVDAYTRERVSKGLMTLVEEVLYFKTEVNGKPYYRPRISWDKTFSYKELDLRSQKIVDQLNNQYFYKRHNEFWKKNALNRLPALIHATDMLVCGEDLGMIPATVPEVMNDLDILSLEIQRMPKGNVTFEDVDTIKYVSVVTTSTHDMSTIREWWEEDRVLTNTYYNQVLHKYGSAPWFCEPWVVKAIIEMHMHSPAMWAIFPLQDLVGMDGAIRRESPREERINVPADPNHYWQYRMHLNIEDLNKEDALTGLIRELVVESGRLSDY